MGSVMEGDLGVFSDGWRSRSVQLVASVIGGDLGVFSQWAQ